MQVADEKKDIFNEKVVKICRLEQKLITRDHVT